MLIGSLVLGPEPEDRSPGSRLLKTTVLEVALIVGATRLREVGGGEKDGEFSANINSLGKLDGALKISLLI